MKVLIVDNHTNFIEPLKSLLKDFEVSVKSYMDLVQEDKDLFDLIILTGGYDRTPVNQNSEDNAKQIELIKTTNKPLIGICYGAQLIAFAFGGIIKELEEKSRGLKSIEFTQDFLDYKTGSSVLVKESHKFAIKQLSETIMGIASSEDGFEIIKIKDREVYGFQFHPEIEKAESGGDEIFIKLLNKLNE